MHRGKDDAGRRPGMAASSAPHLAAIIATLLVFAAPVHSLSAFGQAVDVNQTLFVKEFFNATNGHSWDSIGTGAETWAPESLGQDSNETFVYCNWKGIYCKNPEGTDYQFIYVIDLKGNNLSGKVPRSLAGLLGLEIFNMESNNFDDSPVNEIFDAISGMIGFRKLYLGAAGFAGEVTTAPPPTLELLTASYTENLSGNVSLFKDLQNLGSISISSSGWYGNVEDLPWGNGVLYYAYMPKTRVTGVMGPWICQALALQRISLTALTGITGQIPDCISNLQQMRYMYMEETRISGPLPPGMGDLWRLYVIDFTSVPITGTLEMFHGNFYPYLRYFRFSNTHMDRQPLEPLLSISTKMIDLELDYCKIYGELKLDSFASMPSLRLVRMQSADLVGVFPDLHNNQKLKELQLNMAGSLTGPIRSPFETNPSFNCLLEVFNLGLHNFNGSFPSWVLDCPNLESVQLVGNQLEGPLPSNLGLHASDELQFIDVSDNKLSGPLPSSLSLSPSLTSLYFGGNAFTGHVPNLPPNTRQVLLRDNNFTGPLPDNMFTPGLLPLRRVDVARNQLSGRLPGWLLTHSSNAEKLDFSGNRFSEIEYPFNETDTVSMWLSERIEVLKTVESVDAASADVRSVLLKDGTAITETGSVIRLTPDEVVAASCAAAQQIPALSVQSKLQQVDISGNPLLRDTSSHLAESNETTLTLLLQGHPYLTSLSAANTSFSTTLPAEARRLRYLSSVDLSGVDLLGQNLPFEWGDFDIGYGSGDPEARRYYGRLHSTSPYFPRLQTLILRNTNMHGSLPYALQVLMSLDSLAVLDLGQNPALSGSIEEFAWLYATRSLLEASTGTITMYYDVGTSSAMRVLKQLRLDDTSLSGSLCPNLPSQLLQLDVSRTNVTGSIPDTDAYAQLNFLSAAETPLRGSVVQIPSLTRDVDCSQLPDAAGESLWLASMGSCARNLPSWLPGGQQTASFADSRPAMALRYADTGARRRRSQASSSPTYECSTIAAGTALILLDTEYDDFQRCECSIGYFGIPPLCYPCPSGAISDKGSTTPEQCRCPANTFLNTTISLSPTCEACPAGANAPAGSSKPSACVCPQNSYRLLLEPALGDASMIDCRMCPPGAVTPTAGSVSADSCRCLEGHFLSVADSGEADCVRCPGNGDSPLGSTTFEACQCPANMYAVQGANSASERCRQCPEGSSSQAGSANVEDCKCARGSFLDIVDGSHVCSPCPSGTFADQPGTIGQCSACPTNSSSPEGSTQVTSCACDVGLAPEWATSYQSSASQLPFRCVPCSAHTYKGLPGPSQCVPCDLGSFSSIAAAECRPCADGFLCADAAARPQDGFWHSPAWETAAGEPVGHPDMDSFIRSIAAELRSAGVSNGNQPGDLKGDRELVAGVCGVSGSLTSHGAVQNASMIKNTADHPVCAGARISPSTSAYKCPNDAACVADETGLFMRCTEAYHGPLCGACADGYARTSTSSCSRCLPVGASVFLLIIAAVIAGAVATSLVVRSPGTKSSSSAGVVLRILVQHATMTVMYMQYSPGMDGNLRSALSAFYLFDVYNFAGFPMACAFDPDYEREVVFQALAPLVLAVAVGSALFLLSSVLGVNRTYRTSATLSVSFVLLVLMLPSITRRAAAVFACTDVGGERYLSADTTVPCSGESYDGIMVWGFIMWAIYVCGVQAYTFFVLWRHRHELRQSEVQARLGFVYSGFRLGRATGSEHSTGVDWSFWWWPSVQMLRQTLLVVFMVFTGSSAPTIVALTIFIAGGLQASLEPYESRLLNQLELGSLTIQFLTVSANEHTSSSAFVVVVAVLSYFFMGICLFAAAAIKWSDGGLLCCAPRRITPGKVAKSKNTLSVDTFPPVSDTIQSATPVADHVNMVSPMTAGLSPGTSVPLHVEGATTPGRNGSSGASLAQLSDVKAATVDGQLEGASQGV